MRKMYTANQPLCLGGQIYMFNRYLNVEALVHMTAAQFTMFGHQSRIELNRQDGTPQLFVIPLKDRSFKALNAVQLQDPAHTIKLLGKTLQALYSKAPHWGTVMGHLQPALDSFAGRTDISLAEFNRTIHTAIMGLFVGYRQPVEYLDTTVTPVRSSDPSEWVAEMGRAINCNAYLGGGSAQAAYLREEHFKIRGMTLHIQDYTLKPYKRTNKTIVGNAMVSILDPLFSIGPEDTYTLVMT